MRLGNYHEANEGSRDRRGLGMNEKEKKMDASEPATLTDEQMGEISGGRAGEEPVSEDILGNNGKVVGCVNALGRIVYWKCTHCGLPVYRDWIAYYCDKCNDWWVSRGEYYWDGTKEELIAANAKTL